MPFYGVNFSTVATEVETWYSERYFEETFGLFFSSQCDVTEFKE